jgi:hypothetical protein
MDARIAAYEARAHPRLGDRNATLAALNRMEAMACTMAQQAGDTPVADAGVRTTTYRGLTWRACGSVNRPASSRRNGWTRKPSDRGRGRLDLPPGGRRYAR